ncbi:hypothetical protein CLPU_6c01150 [Gottschalkia purinilytica]|uniref:STAS/SEC14 domain-containing protein n=1 Tax=Gottschalkia purinilytica TaxID=1503 RepID=A0A0L0WAT0_GOTPU|nr:hypothetical protein [Gottschalkia purinilytica]KNF08629.1 hypothetical protein CLPU_6c01150 [Gottschalkia purinilytica]
MIKYENANVTYTMDLNNVKKYIHLQATGFFTEEDGKSFINDYNKIVKTFSTNDYKLIIDASELKASTPQVADILEVLLRRYIEVPFKQRYLVSKSITTKSQFRRLGSQIPGWDVEYVDDAKSLL